MSANRYLNEETQNKVRQRAMYLCEYCHASEQWQYVPFTVDHVIPTLLLIPMLIWQLINKLKIKPQAVLKFDCAESNLVNSY